MDILEKARAYDEALKKIHKFIDGYSRREISKEFLSDIFPELKESGDGRIRKALITFFQRFPYDDIERAGTNVKEAIAWLEKQDKKKSIDDLTAQEAMDIAVEKCFGGGKKDPCEECSCAMLNCTHFPCDKKKESDGEKVAMATMDKVKPKFKVGDFITNDYVFGKIVSVTDDAYLLDTGMGIPFSSQENVHIWTIQDAKDGDILVANIHHWEISGNIEKLPIEVPTIFIYQKVKSDNKNIHAYASLFDNTTLDIYKNMYYIDEYGIKYICPATQEQCTLLFQKIKEAGYKWDADKKELKKIEQKPTWSEEDEDKFNKVIDELTPFGECPDNPDWEQREYYHGRDVMIDWLKSLKDRLKGELYG